MMDSGKEQLRVTVVVSQDGNADECELDMLLSMLADALLDRVAARLQAIESGVLGAHASDDSTEGDDSPEGDDSDEELYS